ncbi:MAG: hypothetical protein A2297_05045 [Elusimicrobia bacterium RIFOXYB2_FULL_48_7]|nr:MAG: hypothetical protein A2297_05045 [Elusimicrobia bacterium RIFOXYB2_FULL_48_7]
MEELESGRNNYESVPGLVWKKDGQVIVNPHPEKIVFNNYPNPARDLLPNDLYAEFPTQRKNFTAMVTSLGCPYECKFCEAGGCTYNPRSPGKVVNEMKECVEKYDIHEIDIFDYEFTAIRSRVKEICRLIKDNNLAITWVCRSRIDTVDQDLLKTMYDSGCRRIYWGIEHGSQEVLDYFGKGIKLDQVVSTIEISKQTGIQNLGFFLVGVPGETKKTVRKTLDFAKKLDLDYVQFSKLLAKPLTPMWKQMVQETGKDYWRDWVLGNEKDRELPRPWLKTITNEEVDKLARWAYIKYHSRLGFLLRHAFNCKSISELLRKSLAYFEMIILQENVSKPAKKFIAYSENIFKVMLKRLEWVKRNG